MDKNNWAEKFGKIMKRMETRKRNTLQAKDDIATIMKMLTEITPDQVSGFGTNKEFNIKASWWDNGWVYYNDYAYFAIKKGKVCIRGSYGTVFDMDDINYVNFRELVPALIEFINNLLNINTWEEETATIEEIKDSLIKLKRD